MLTADQEWIEELRGEVTDLGAEPSYVLPLIAGRDELGLLLGCPRLSGLAGLALRTLYASGMREGELLELNEHSRGDGVWLKICGQRPRTVVVDADTAQALAELAQGGGPRLFDLTAEQLHQWLQEAAQWAGLTARFTGSGRNLTTATLRHAFATHRLEQGMNLATLHSLLGHDSATVTLLYLQTAVGLRGEDYARSHPLMSEQRRPDHWTRRDWPEQRSTFNDLPQPDRGKPPATPTVAEVLAMIAAAHKQRDHLILRVFYATGVRLAELLDLLYLDLDFAEQRLFVRQGKGGKDRYCLIDGVTLAALRDLKSEWKPDDSLFGLKSETPVEKVVRQLAVETGIFDKYGAQGKTVSPHSFRHAFATHCYLNGMALGSLKRLLGHEKLETTQDYLQIPFAHVRQAYQASHPLGHDV